MNKQRTPSATLRLLRSTSQPAPSATSERKPLSRLADKLTCLAESLEKMAQQAAGENLDMTNHDEFSAGKQTHITQTNFTQTTLTETNPRQTDLKPIMANNPKKSDVNHSKKARHLRLIS